MKKTISRSIRLLPILLTACSKFVAVDTPTTQLVTATVFTNDASATSAVVGIYSNMMSANLGLYGGALTLDCGLSADEYQNYSFSTDQSELATNQIKSGNQIIKLLWGQAYQYIYAANAIIEGLSTSKGISAPVVQELMGEVKFVRAFTYFYLVNLWGEVPLVLSTRYTVNDTLHRTETKIIYAQIIQDLRDAEELLTPDYTAGGGERIRPNRFAAAALLARVLLYTQNWQDAFDKSTAVINESDLYGLSSDLTQVFLANNSEAIWQLEPVTPNMNTWEGNYFILTGGTSSSPAQITLSSTLLSSFEVNDQRKINWTNVDTTGGQNNFYPFKYKVRTGIPILEYETVLRLAEQYLIRAEAEIHLGNLTEAISDINMTRRRAGLSDLVGSLTTQQCLEAVSQERKIELFSEWGHRWMDLKRTGQTTDTLGPKKPGWLATDTLYPIPRTEIQNNPNLSQNPGY